MKIQTSVITLRSLFTAWTINWTEASFPWDVCGSWSLTGTPCHPHTAQTGSLYLQALSIYESSTVSWARVPFLWPPQIQQHPPLSAQGRENSTRVIPSDKMTKPSQQRSFWLRQIIQLFEEHKLIQMMESKRLECGHLLEKIIKGNDTSKNATHFRAKLKMKL